MLNISLPAQRKLFDQYFEARKSVYASNVTFDSYTGYHSRYNEMFVEFIRDCMTFASNFEQNVISHCRRQLIEKYGDRAKTVLSQLY